MCCFFNKAYLRIPFDIIKKPKVILLYHCWNHVLFSFIVVKDAASHSTNYSLPPPSPPAEIPPDRRIVKGQGRRIAQISKGLLLRKLHSGKFPKVNSPLIRPAISWGGGIGGVPGPLGSISPGQLPFQGDEKAAKFSMILRVFFSRLALPSGQ